MPSPPARLLLARLSLGCALIAMAWAPAARADDDKPTLGVRYTTDVLGTISGGLERDARWLGRLDVLADSGDRLLGIDGLSAHADLMLVHGGGLSDRIVGDAQVVSNVDAPVALRPFEAWVEASPGGNVRLKAGFIDLNSEFDVQSVGALFLNSSFGIAPDYSQSGQNGPSIFPVTSPGLLVAVERKRWTIRAAVFDAVPGSPAYPHRFLPGPFGTGGALLAVEGDIKVGAGGELQAGAWRYTDRFPRLDGNGRSVSAGMYVQYEQVLLDKQVPGAVRGWLRVGHAASRVNPIGLYVGGGLSWGSDKARLGLAVGHARLGNPGLAAVAAVDPAFRAETAGELTGYLRLTSWLAVQPDLQYVRHPGWKATPDALVAGLRLHFSIGGKD